MQEFYSLLDVLIGASIPISAIATRDGSHGLSGLSDYMGSLRYVHVSVFSVEADEGTESPCRGKQSSLESQGTNLEESFFVTQSPVHLQPFRFFCLIKML